MSLIWKSPFNKVVRSTEAAIAGFLVGILVGTLFIIIAPIRLSGDDVIESINKCKSVKDIKEISVRYSGTVSNVKCVSK
jgi:hypothetical protein